MEQLKIFLLDGTRIEKDGELFTDLESDQIMALLSYLLVERDYEHTRESLIELFWPEAIETTARNQLRVALYRIKQAFADMLEGESLFVGNNRSIRYNPRCRVWVDVIQFQSVVERYQDDFLNTSSLSASAIYELNEALKLYKGEFLHDL
jgi:DNA-binding SARP family transcriptional activator